MKLLDIKEGKNQLEILSIIANFQLKSNKALPKQKDITQKSSLTKGAVSNNCKKLENQEIINKKDKKYQISKQKTLELYKEYIEPYFTRETPKGELKNEIKKLNQIKTKTNQKINQIIRDYEKEIFNLILIVLSKSKPRKTKNIREAFEKVNQTLLSLTHKLLFLSDNQEAIDELSELIKLSLCLDIEKNQIMKLVESISHEVDVEDLKLSFDEIGVS